MEVNSNTPPFPVSLLIKSKVFVSVSVSDPALTEMSGLEAVEYPFSSPVNDICIVFSSNVPVDVTEISECSPVNCDVIVIAKY